MDGDTRRTAVLGALLGVDALLIVLHLVTSPPAFDISRDYGVAEFVSYVKLLATVLLLLRARRRALAGSRRTALPDRAGGHLLGWAIIFGYLLVDDLLRFHEFFGEGLVRLFDDPNRHLLGGLRTEDLGELTILVAAAIPLLTLVAVNYARGSAASRRTDRVFALLLVIMTAFAVGVDLVGAVFTDSSLPLLEDGGELVVLSVITSYAYSLSVYDAPHGEAQLPHRRRFRHR
jgi:hypothetical protein